jgi:DNA-binding MarR family transcriptional regulator
MERLRGSTGHSWIRFIAYLVYLTDLGRSLQSAVEEGWIAIEQQILEGFSLEERLLLRRYLEQIYKNLS